jgi:ubiquinone/menaquinone biosynthesis C-methylase UbiE
VTPASLGGEEVRGDATETAFWAGRSSHSVRRSARLPSLFSPSPDWSVSSYSFDALADTFDRTRTIDPTAFDAALAFFTERFPPKRMERALEIGVGTGRIAIPLAARGYHVVGIDISPRMLHHLTERGPPPSTNRVEPLIADATILPFRPASFDLVYWIHVLHLIPNWRRAVDEALRVLRPGGMVMAMSTGRGREIPLLFRRYQRIARQHGFSRPRLGARHRETVFRYLAQRGCRIQCVPDQWSWETEVPVAQALEDIQARVYAAVRFTPAKVHARVMTELRRWARTRWEGKHPTVQVPSAITLQLAFKGRRTRHRRKSSTPSVESDARVLRTQKS